MKLMSTVLNRHQSTPILLCHGRAVIDPYELWRSVNVDQYFQDRGNVIPAHGSRHFNGEYFFAEFIGDVQVFHHTTVAGLIELEIQQPHVIRAMSAKPVLRVTGLP
jgi:hypothetical protein